MNDKERGAIILAGAQREAPGSRSWVLPRNLRFDERGELRE